MPLKYIYELEVALDLAKQGNYSEVITAIKQRIRLIEQDTGLMSYQPQTSQKHIPSTFLGYQMDDAIMNFKVSSLFNLLRKGANPNTCYMGSPVLFRTHVDGLDALSRAEDSFDDFLTRTGGKFYDHPCHDSWYLVDPLQPAPEAVPSNTKRWPNRTLLEQELYTQFFQRPGKLPMMAVFEQQ